MSFTQQVISDFDELADLIGPGESGTDYYDPYLLSLIPSSAQNVLDIGCGLGRLTRAIANTKRRVLGIDVSPRMIERAHSDGSPAGVTFLEADFLSVDFDEQTFDCIISAAALHHMPYGVALSRMRSLLRPGGHLIIHDIRQDSSAGDVLRSYSALSGIMLRRLIRTGRLRQSRAVREAWDRHGAHEVYPSMTAASDLVSRHLPGATLIYHWLWRYTIIWESPPVHGLVRRLRL